MQKLLAPLRSMTRQATRWANHLLPTECILCGETLGGDLLCEPCLFDLPWVQGDEQHCLQCALSLTSPADYCGHCLANPPAFSRSYIPFAYQHPLTPLIHRFKYRRNLACGKLLGKLLAQHISDCALQDNWHTPDLLIPTPLHWTRRWQRGFNQTEIIAHYLARTTGIPLASRLVQRTARTPAQKELTRRERQQNLRKAFFMSEKAKHIIEGKCVALIDDVMTTTATMRELSQLLISAGAKDVQIWALARTMET